MALASPRKVLIVDDNVGLAENIAEILQIDGHVTEVAASAEAALDMVRASEPDVLVTDYRLPGMSGAALVKHLSGTGSRVLAVVISAYTDERTIKEACDSGAAFMAKPVDFEVLSQYVREARA